MTNRSTHPASASNEISEAYYMTVVEMQNAGTTNLRVAKILRQHGTYCYHTHHLITSP
ncbi:hypothetical protein HXA34_20455 [Salipaludibacillus agaradhaerens]|jgi:hypothetical protein|uniref:hypothetical protein n=1 Tax=Salipaludibacillus agaradhaerens TaxID=76935 RepID=UPI002151A878|nr:hypothetical protein [Salipaludibacillus agaradhaerens]MCR6108670.1 hypothetical protein [Salipaludibacillus agaradhaerens]MCR6120694.1 hypothetical protein [Salipaludibacillus agaradhaerens]